MLYPSRHLLRDPLFASPIHKLSSAEQARRSYQRARAIARVYGLSENDVSTLSDKFWLLHSDPIATLDAAAFTLLTIHYNLALGTILQHPVESSSNDPLKAIVKQLMSFDLIGQFMLTELDHGLDCLHLETTAVRLPGGGFELHTPQPGASKWMPPTAPAGIPCIAVVFARLVVDDVFCGIRPFLVPLNDGEKMCPGVTCRLAPHRGGSAPVNHSLTSFNHVYLPSWSLLGELKANVSSYDFFKKTIWRVAVGAMALGSICVSVMYLASISSALYSLRRTVMSLDNSPRPIFAFRTQQLPILRGFAHSYVMQAFQRRAVRLFTDPSIDQRVRHGIAVAFKAVLVQSTQNTSWSVSERLGAQGLFGHNRLTTWISDVRGIAIAEGDILGTSMRLATELLVGRYEMPEATSNSLLAQHESGLFSESMERLGEMGAPTLPGLQNHIFPRCQAMVEAIGHRMAYDAAVEAKIHPCLLELYQLSVMQLDLAWYVENGLVTRKEILDRENRAVEDALPLVQQFLGADDFRAYVTAPIVSDETWKAFVSTWETFEGDSLEIERPRAHEKIVFIERASL